MGGLASYCVKPPPPAVHWVHVEGCGIFETLFFFCFGFNYVLCNYEEKALNYLKWSVNADSNDHIWFTDSVLSQVFQTILSPVTFKRYGFNHLCLLDIIIKGKKINRLYPTDQLLLSLQIEDRIPSWYFSQQIWWKLPWPWDDLQLLVLQKINARLFDHLRCVKQNGFLWKYSPV